MAVIKALNNKDVATMALIKTTILRNKNVGY